MSFIDTKPGIYQSIIDELNLDFTCTCTCTCTISLSCETGVNSYYSSPIIERIDLNNVFNTFTTNTASVTEPVISNSLGINSNRNSLTLNTSIDAFTNRPRSTELLNCQSNMLYLLINKLSFSVY